MNIQAELAEAYETTLRHIVSPGQSLIGYSQTLLCGKKLVIKNNAHHFGDGVVAFPDHWTVLQRFRWRQEHRVPGEEWMPPRASNRALAAS
jgi:hypothetical protein